MAEIPFVEIISRIGEDVAESIKSVRDELTARIDVISEAAQDALSKVSQAQEMVACATQPITQALGEVESKLVRLESRAAEIEGSVIHDMGENIRAEVGALQKATEDALTALKSASDDALCALQTRVGALESVEQLTRAELAGEAEKAAQAIVGGALKTTGDVMSAQIAGEIEKRVSVWALDFERRASEVLQRAIDRIPLPEDGMGFDDASMEHDGKRTFSFVLQQGQRRKEYSFKVPVMLYTGIFDEAKVYDAGDVSTWGGSSWIALKNAPAGKPGHSTDWQLIVKKGRDGKPA